MNKNKSKKLIDMISIILYTTLLLISSILIFQSIKLNIIPYKYLIPILIGYILFITITFILIFPKKMKLVFKAFASILCIVGIIASLLGLYYLNNTVNMINKIQEANYQLEDYYIVVKKDSKYRTITDLKESDLAIYKNEINNYQKSINHVKDLIKINVKEYNDFILATDALLESQVDALLISSGYMSILNEEKENFEKDTKIIYKMSQKIENQVEVKEAKVTQESFNVYISGIDVYGDIKAVSRSDVNLLMTVNPSNHNILITSIPRDYYVQLHGTNGYKDKLTHAGIYGIDMSIKTIEDLLEDDINYYIRVNFTTLINIVDLIGGIDVTSDYDFISDSGKYHFTKGVNHLDGKKALAFSRERKAFETGDRERNQNQQKVLMAIINKALNSKSLILNYNQFLTSLSNSFQTNLDSNIIYSLVNMQLEKMPKWNIETISLDGYDKRDYTYSYPNRTLYVMEPDMNTINLAKEKIKKMKS